MGDYRIRRASEPDRPDTLALVSEMFRADVSDRLAWLYYGNPHGEALTWMAFDADDRAVAVTSLFPRRVSIEGRLVTASIGGDCYVVPAARRRGLATLLHRASLAGMRAGGVSFMYGPPRPNNLAALVKAGSREVGAFQRHARPLTLDALLKRSVPHALSRLAAWPDRALGRLLRGDGGAVVEDVTEFGDEWDALTRRMRWLAAICPVRDAAYLRWRYATGRQVTLAVRRRGELVGFAAYEAQDDVAVVVDAFAVDRQAMDAALGALIDRARGERRAHVDFYVTSACLDPWMLRRHGFIGRERHGFQVFIPDGEPAHELLTSPASWFFTEGDKDMPSAFSAEPE
jgi:hypothetical protein